MDFVTDVMEGMDIPESVKTVVLATGLKALSFLPTALVAVLGIFGKVILGAKIAILVAAIFFYKNYFAASSFNDLAGAASNQQYYDLNMPNVGSQAQAAHRQAYSGQIPNGQ